MVVTCDTVNGSQLNERTTQQEGLTSGCFGLEGLCQPRRLKVRVKMVQ